MSTALLHTGTHEKQAVLKKKKLIDCMYLHDL